MWITSWIEKFGSIRQVWLWSTKSTMEGRLFVDQFLHGTFYMIVLDFLLFYGCNSFKGSILFKHSRSFQIQSLEGKMYSLEYKAHITFNRTIFHYKVIKLHYKREYQNYTKKSHLWLRVDLWSTVNFLVKQFTKVKLPNPTFLFILKVSHLWSSKS